MYEFDPLLPPEESLSMVRLREHEWGPNPNHEAKSIKTVAVNSKHYELGKCRLIDHQLLSKALYQFLEGHDERLNDESLARLKAIVETTRTALFDDSETLSGSVALKKPRKPTQTTKAKQTDLPLPFTTPEPRVSSVKEEFAQENIAYWHIPDEELRATAFDSLPKVSSTGLKRDGYMRSVAVRVYVQKRANGFCEGCGQPAPFTTVNNKPYLESHHTIPVSEGGPDHPHWVIALCPACHRHAHYANDAKAFNDRLIEVVNAVEP